MASAVALLGVAFPGSAEAVDPVAGSAGIDTSAPLTDSQLTLSGRGRFSELRVTVNQTKQLANQALSVTWTGGTATISYPGPAPFAEHYLQMFQCWGDDDGTNPENPGPPPHQCVQGALNGVFGGSPAGTLFPGNTSNRVISQRGHPNFDPSLGELDKDGSVSLPFRAVDGTVVPQWRDTAFNPQLGGGSYWLNPFFDITTTNEIAGARTAANGKGAALFEATTGLESSGLGCGQRVQKQADGSTRIPKCWLVVVPRGGVAEENEGALADPNLGVFTSPLAPAVWKNRIAVPLDFNPLDSPCELSADQRRIVGSELFSAAVFSWQPALCATPGLSPFAYGALSESRARQQLVSGTAGAPGMAVVARPLDPASLDGKNPVVYAPLTLSGTVVGFNLERIPQTNFPAGAPAAEVLAAEEQLRSVRVAELNLTPRLMAKLLTQSYRSQVEIAASKPPYPWSTKNPFNVGGDPDFLQFNPEFNLLSITTKNTGGFVMPGPNSDAALQMWEWIFADPEARAWLAGAPDPWGMNLNPIYSTVAAVNPQGAAFGDPLPDVYPKSDPYCYQGPPLGTAKVVPPTVCGLDWLPYAQSVRDSARATRAASDGSRGSVVNTDALTPDQVYKRDLPQLPGQREMLSITDTASAAQYGLQTARLSRAGDNGADRRFIAANADGLAAGGQALAPKDVPGFLEPNPTAAAPSAYPLTAITYAAVTPLSLDATARKEYAAFVDYAAGPGQVRGFEYGRLPGGYQPLPEALRAQGKEAATKIRELRAADQEDPAAAASEKDEGAGGDAADSSQTGADGVAGTSDDVVTSLPQSPGSPVPLQPQANPPSTSPLRKIVDAISTPLSKLAGTRYALPVLLVVAALTALGALEISRRRPRLNAPADGVRPLDIEPGTG